MKLVGCDEIHSSSDNTTGIYKVLNISVFHHGTERLLPKTVNDGVIGLVYCRYPGNGEIKRNMF